MSNEQIGGLDLSAVISKLTENPALLSGIISSLSNSAGDSHQKTEEAEKSAPSSVSIDPEKISKLLPMVSAIGGVQGQDHPPKSSNPRCDLLRALRPFLSPERCEAIDYMIKMDGLSGLLQNFKK